MHIRLKDINEVALTLEFEEASETFPVLTEMVDTGVCEFLAPVKTALSAQQIGDMVEIEGSISTAVRLSCGRCLQSFETPVESSFALTYKQTELDTDKGSSSQEELELTIEDMGLIYHQGEEINLQNEIQEQVVLAFPLRALCKPDCKGLCPQCGADLNNEECDCDQTPHAGKFAVLKKLKLKP